MTIPFPPTTTVPFIFGVEGTVEEQSIETPAGTAGVWFVKVQVMVPATAFTFFVEEVVIVPAV